MMAPNDPDWFRQRVDQINRDFTPRPVDTVEPLPPLPDKTWRVVGMWNDLREFLIVMGVSEADCLERLKKAMRVYSAEETLKFDAIWLEEWSYEEWSDRWRWIPTTEIDLLHIRLRAAAFEHHGQEVSSAMHPGQVA